MGVEKLQDMILICLNVFIADYVSLVLSMQLSKGQILNSQPRQEKSFIITKKNFWRMEIVGESILSANIKADNPYR